MEFVECRDLIHEDIRSLLDGINTSSVEMEAFFVALSKEWQQQVDKDQTLKDKISKENSNKVIADMIAALDKKKKQPSTKEVFTPTSLLDFVSKYCKAEIKPFWDYYIDIEDEISDGCKFVLTEADICYGGKKARKKVDNAIKEYAHAPSGLSYSYDIKEYTPSFDVFAADVLVKFDTTVFGSGKTGICFTNNFLVFKGISTIPHSLYYYRKIDKISVDTDDKELIIKGLSSTGDKGDYFEYICHNINDPLTKVVGCVNEYISQPGLKVVKYLEKM